MKATPARSRGFTLIELLVVIGIMAILAVVALPALKSTNSAAQLGGASQQLSDQLKLASQLARTRNIPVEVRLYKIADPLDKTGTSKIFRAYQSFYVNDTTYDPAGKVSFLPTGLTMVENASYSTLITDASSTVTGTLSNPTLGSGYQYAYFQFRPDGSLSIPNTATTTTVWTLTVQPQQGPPNASISGLKQNYAVITVDPVIGTVRLTRP